jgi:hypothetical protein
VVFVLEEDVVMMGVLTPLLIFRLPPLPGEENGG